MKFTYDKAQKHLRIFDHDCGLAYVIEGAVDGRSALGIVNFCLSGLSEMWLTEALSGSEELDEIVEGFDTAKTGVVYGKQVKDIQDVFEGKGFSVTDILAKSSAVRSDLGRVLLPEGRKKTFGDLVEASVKDQMSGLLRYLELPQKILSFTVRDTADESLKFVEASIVSNIDEAFPEDWAETSGIATLGKPPAGGELNSVFNVKEIERRADGLVRRSVRFRGDTSIYAVDLLLTRVRGVLLPEGKIINRSVLEGTTIRITSIDARSGFSTAEAMFDWTIPAHLFKGGKDDDDDIVLEQCGMPVINALCLFDFDYVVNLEGSAKIVNVSVDLGNYLARRMKREKQLEGGVETSDALKTFLQDENILIETLGKFRFGKEGSVFYSVKGKEEAKHIKDGTLINKNKLINMTNSLVGRVFNDVETLYLSSINHKRQKRPIVIDIKKIDDVKNIKVSVVDLLGSEEQDLYSMEFQLEVSFVITNSQVEMPCTTPAWVFLAAQSDESDVMRGMIAELRAMSLLLQSGLKWGGKERGLSELPSIHSRAGSKANIQEVTERGQFMTLLTRAGLLVIHESHKRDKIQMMLKEHYLDWNMLKLYESDGEIKLVAVMPDPRALVAFPSSNSLDSHQRVNIDLEEKVSSYKLHELGTQMRGQGAIYSYKIAGDSFIVDIPCSVDEGGVNGSSFERRLDFVLEEIESLAGYGEVVLQDGAIRESKTQTRTSEQSMRLKKTNPVSLCLVRKVSIVESKKYPSLAEGIWEGCLGNYFIVERKGKSVEVYQGVAAGHAYSAKMAELYPSLLNAGSAV